MAKISIGLHGWRFEESDVFDEDGEFRPLGEMPPETQERLLRLMSIVDAPCDACWLLHGDENREEWERASAVYGEPESEVLLCADHEQDFIYWYREAGGSRFRGEERLEDEFHEWFLDGGRAPEGYEGIEHVATDPADLPNPTVEEGDQPFDDLDPDELDPDEFDLSQEYPS